MSRKTRKQGEAETLASPASIPPCPSSLLLGTDPSLSDSRLLQDVEDFLDHFCDMRLLVVHSQYVELHWIHERCRYGVHV